jgi:hypothetical protein
MFQIKNYFEPITARCKWCGEKMSAGNYNELIYTLNQEKWEHRLFGNKRFEILCPRCQDEYVLNEHDIIENDEKIFNPAIYEAEHDRLMAEWEERDHGPREKRSIHYNNARARE